MTTLELRGRLTCSQASSAATKKRRTTTLWGSDRHGKFRTRGRNATATVRGTVWRTTDRCDGTLVTVSSGRVSVRDSVRQAHRHGPQGPPLPGSQPPPLAACGADQAFAPSRSPRSSGPRSGSSCCSRASGTRSRTRRSTPARACRPTARRGRSRSWRSTPKTFDPPNDEVWPFKRSRHAEVIDQLRRAGAKTVVYDVQFTEPTKNPEDLALFDAVARKPGTVLAATEVDAKGEHEGPRRRREHRRRQGARRAWRTCRPTPAA